MVITYTTDTHHGAPTGRNGARIAAKYSTAFGLERFVATPVR